MTKKHKENLLKKHPFDISPGKDGRYRTYVKDVTNGYGRRMIVKSHKEDLLDYLINIYEKQEKDNSIKDYTPERIYPDWKSYKEIHTTAKNYIRRIDNDWKKYYVGTDIIKKPHKQLKKLDLDTWAHQLIQDNNMTKKQYYNATIIMRQALDYAVDLGIIAENPFSAVHIDGKRMFRQEKKNRCYRCYAGISKK